MSHEFVRQYRHDSECRPAATFDTLPPLATERSENEAVH